MPSPLILPKNENGTSVPRQVTDGLRVLGLPVGSTSFCNAFINKQSHPHNQMLQNWYETLTTCKPPSAFSACARRTKSPTSSATQNTILDWRLEELPNKFLPWDSPMTTQFGAMTFSLLAHITNANTLPPHTQLMANISINEGGLGIQTPRTNAITSYMTTSKRCLQYACDGVWLGYNKAQPQFPPAIKLLYDDWETSSNRSWTISANTYPPLMKPSCTNPTPTPTTFTRHLSMALEKK